MRTVNEEVVAESSQDFRPTSHSLSEQTGHRAEFVNLLQLQLAGC